MKKLVYLFCFLVFNSIAQDLDLRWTDKMYFDNRLEGFFDGFLSTNDQYTYSINKNLALSTKKENSKIKLIAHDKETLEKKFELALIGYPENKLSEDQYKGLRYYKTSIYNDKVMVFWIKEEKDKQSLYVETFSPELKKESKLTKIYTYTYPEKLKKISFTNFSYLEVLSNEKVNDKIIIGSEIQQNEEASTFSFIIIDKELNVSEKKSIQLPGILDGRSRGKNSKYKLGDDGNIYITTYIKVNKEEAKQARKEKKGIDLSYCVFSIWNIKTNDLAEFEIKDENKVINDFSYLINENGIKIYGFFGDLEKDKSGNSTHGIFYSVINNKDMDFDGLNYTYFSKKQLDDLFKNDEEAKKQATGLTKKAKKKSQENADESINWNYTIEWLFEDKEDVVLFFSKMNNYSVTTCTQSSTGGQSCTTRYYCAKSNVTSMKISPEGEIVWGSHIDRSKTYNGWDIYDLNIIQTNDAYIVIYGSSYNDVEGKNKQKRKKASEARDSFEYGVFNKENGQNSKNIFQVNQKTDEDKKTVDAVKIQVLDNRFYVYNIKIKQKWGKSIPLCLAGVACPYIAIIPFLNGNYKKGEGNYGIITAIEGGDSKKKAKKKK
jgi:hypothetical protein